MEYEKSLTNQIKTNPKVLYRYIKQKQKVKDTIGPLERDDGTLVDSGVDLANDLNKFFESTFVHEDISDVPDFPDRVHDNICEIQVTKKCVVDKLLNLNVNKTPGPDDMHPYLLKQCADSLSSPLQYLFNQSLTPTDWKQANVTPIFKKGSKSKACNYRPISLTSQVVKILESIIRDTLYGFLENHQVFSPHQHGFVKGKSCLSNLLESLDLWTEALDNNLGVDIIYLDYRKAFDTVPHQRLVKKLNGYGIRGNILAWLSNFLNHRYQRVVVNGTASQWVCVKSGVPQGSVLGPLLFTLYVNDIPDIIQCNIKLFADDTKIFSIIKNKSDQDKLQCDLSSLCDWCVKWLLSFNIDKCKLLQLGKSLPAVYTLLDQESHQYLPITQVSEEKDLGVWFSSNLKPSLQCQKNSARAMQALGLIRRSFKYLTKESLTTLYKVYVRPHLEYCVQSWSPYFAKDIDMLERVQHRATKLVESIASLPYETRLKELNLPSLYCRRERGDLIETFKILKKFITTTLYNRFSICTSRRTRGHQYKLIKERFHTQCRQNYFTNRVVNIWNSLPQSIVSANTVNSFKCKLDDFWQSTGYGQTERPTA